MGLFSNLFKSPNTIPLLNESELNMVLSFYENGWARNIQRQMGINDSAFSSINEHTLIRGLKKRCLTPDEIRSVICVLKKDMKQNGGDPDEKEIIRKLKACLYGVTEEKAPVGREKELLPCPVCGRLAFMDKMSRGWSVGCPAFTVYDDVHHVTENAPVRDRFCFHDCQTEDDAIRIWNDRVNRYLEENEMM